MDASPVWLIPATFPVAKTLPALRSLPPSHVKKRPRLMVARYSLAGWPGVRPPNGTVFDSGIALCYPGGLHGARPVAWIVLPCRMARCSTAGLYSVRPPEKWRFLRYTNARSTRSGGREPAVVRSHDRCVGRSECCSASSEYTTRSGVRQPAVVGETHLQVRFRKVAGDRHRCAHERRCSGGSEPTGG